MGKPIELQSLVETHEQPFVVIDRDYRIVAVNQAFENAYHVNRAEILGRRCYEAEHHNDSPCHEHGEDCPYLQVYQTEQPHSCLHAHYDGKGRTRWVRVNVHPLKAADGTIYLGEMLQEIAERDVETPKQHPTPVGRSPVFLRTMEQLDVAAKADAPVLLLGETGTGKELAAAFIHHHSKRRHHPFLTVDCTVLTETLFESEMFGHERGAFTGSVGAKKGLFELADGGTLFLDEVGDMPAPMQAKLLRVLESGEFRRVGSAKTQKADVRVVCATNRHLWDSVKAGAFREDLYYRIACFCVRMPALRERLEDIPLVAKSLLQRMGQSNGRSYRLAPGAARVLQGQGFPGNVRELRNILRVAAAHAANANIAARDVEQGLLRNKELLEHVAASVPAPSAILPTPAGTGGSSAAPATEPIPGDGRPLQTLEAKHIAALLSRYAGHRRKVADILGISERTLYRKLKRYDLR